MKVVHGQVLIQLFYNLCFVRLSIASTYNYPQGYRYLKSLNDDDDRIIGGELAKIRDYPSMAALVEELSFYTHFYKCGTVIINKYWTLTAAHCIQSIANEDIRDKRIYVHSNSRYWAKHYRRHLITAAYMHEKYKRSDYDIAIVRVLKPFTGKYERPIPFVSRQYQYVDGSTATAVGWGSTNPHEGFVVDKLRFVEVKIVNFNSCKKIYGELQHPKNVTQNVVCALAPGKDSCRSDSGGPLYQANKLIGIVSWGPVPCADPVKPGVYTRISAVSQWIVDKMKRQKMNRNANDTDGKTLC